MIHIFIDTDIILDFLGDRKPFSRFALQIFNRSGKILSLHTSGNSITIAYYILCKYTNETNARRLILNLLDYLNVIPVTNSILTKAFKSNFKDVEDAVQHFCALTNQEIKYLVTRNLKDYKHSQIEVLNSEDLIRFLG